MQELVKFGSMSRERATERRPRILMTAYYCSPCKGSDWGVGWARAVHAANRFDVVVITNETSRVDIEAYIQNHGPIPHLRFCYTEAGNDKGLLAKLPKSVLYVNPFLYAGWQRAAMALARLLHEQCRFDLAHQVTLIGYRQPLKLYELGIPFVWGPIGGTQNFPLRFLPSLGLFGALQEGIRNAINSLQIRCSRRVRA